MSRCKNLSKCLNGKLRCKYFKQQITLKKCKNCSKTTLEINKPIKKISKKEKVTQETYSKVFERDNGRCRLHDIGTCEGRLELHHIKYRSERKDLINEPSNCILLCTKHHKEVHNNKHYWQKELEERVKNE